MTQSPGIEPGPHWWEASALTTAPSLLPRCGGILRKEESADRFLRGDRFTLTRCQRLKRQHSNLNYGGWPNHIINSMDKNQTFLLGLSK